MEKAQLTIEPRENVGKGFARRLRTAGKVPGVLYGLGAHRTLVADPRVIEKALLSDGGKNVVFSLNGDGVDGKHALVKDYQVDPVTRKLLHVDLIEIDVMKKVDVTVTIQVVGKCVGVVNGGIINVVEREIEIRALPNAIPKHIDVDVTNLDIGDSLHVDDIQLPEGVEKAHPDFNPTLVTVVPPASEEEATASVEGAAAPEVIGEKKKDDVAGGDKEKK